MLWNYYAFRRGSDVQEMWQDLFHARPVKLLYISGRGFDVRAQKVIQEFVETLKTSAAQLQTAELLLVRLPGYHLGPDLRQQTQTNEQVLSAQFSTLGIASTAIVTASASSEDDMSPTNALQLGVAAVLARITDHTDIILDVSSLPRVMFLALLNGLLNRLIPDKLATNALAAQGVNLQVVVTDDPVLDAQIRSEDPSNDLITIPGFSSALHEEAVQDWPLVWFPILGENRVSQLQRVATEIPKSAEICPILPHPSREPRRADRLIIEYKEPLFDSRRTPTGNILYAHESNPFEAYRHLLLAMQRYRDSLNIMGGSRLVVTPLASKLMTVAAGLACFEMRPDSLSAHYRVGMPYAEATRYTVDMAHLQASKPELCALVLTGDAYAMG
jgi:hypothetical protein